MTVANVRGSVGSVAAALEHFAASLDAAGYEEGAETYARMADIVVGQRVWAASTGEAELDDEFRRVAVLARRIHGLLTPYVESMARLATLDAPELAPDGAPESLDGRILGTLRERGHALSLTAITTAVGEPTSKVRGVLVDLEQRGLVTRSSRGGRLYFAIRS